VQALWIANQQLSLKSDLDLPSLPSGHALIKVDCAGICGTDLGLLQGYYPFTGIPGHEFVGTVERGPAHWSGQRVVGEVNITCGFCDACKHARSNHCENRQVLGIKNHHGAFAQYLTLPIDNLYRVPDSLSDEVAVFTEPVAAALQILQQIDINQEHKVVVIGAGRLGQLIAQALFLTGCQLLVIGRNPKKLEHLQRMGIATACGGHQPDRIFDIAVECSGNPQGFALARACIRPQGVLVLKSTYAGNIEIDMSSLVVDEISLLGSRCGPFDKALAMLSSAQIKVDYLPTKVFALSAGIEAFDYAGQAGVLKVLIKPGQ